MSDFAMRPSGPFRGRGRVPGDKSISHRALLLGALADGDSQVSGFLPSGDCRATMTCLQALGIEVRSHDATSLTICGRGLHGLQKPRAPLNCVRSGTTMRLLAGILAGQSFASELTGGAQLLGRPMRRIVDPLRRAGARIEETDGHAPLAIYGERLHSCEHSLAIASAQVKSALLLAGLYADGPTVVHQPGPARDHTERMLAAMGASIDVTDLTVTLAPQSSLSPLAFIVPGDMSSAAFALAAAALLPESEVSIVGVGLNSTRTGLLDVMRKMGTDVALGNVRDEGGEPVGDVTVRSSELHCVEIGGHTVVRMIDEFPALAVLATQAHGTTVVRDAAELRVKETDRIASIVTELRALGARIEPLPDGFAVEGPTRLRGGVVHSHGDHRMAMALTVAGMVAQEEVLIRDTDCISDSFPGFLKWMKRFQSSTPTTLAD